MCVRLINLRLSGGDERRILISRQRTFFPPQPLQLVGPQPHSGAGGSAQLWRLAACLHLAVVCL